MHFGISYLPSENRSVRGRHTRRDDTVADPSLSIQHGVRQSDRLWLPGEEQLGRKCLLERLVLIVLAGGDNKHVGVAPLLGVVLPGRERFSFRAKPQPVAFAARTDAVARRLEHGNWGVRWAAVDPDGKAPVEGDARPSEWRKALDSRGRAYWWHTESLEVKWDEAGVF